MKKMLVLLLISTVAVPSLLLAKGPRGGGKDAAVSTTSTLDEQEIIDATWMREEEKLARDVYREMFALWGNPVFSNISTSEQSHLDAMGELVDRNGIDDPVKTDDTGVFTNPDLQQWYYELIDRGSKSLVEAIKVGITIEESDMQDIQAAIDNTDEADIKKTYENLIRGSRNHLRAYVNQLESLGLIYEPELLTAEEAYAIVDSATERR